MWLVVGANGQLGRCLTHSLVAAGIEFEATSSQELDITNSEQVKDFFQQTNYSTVINCAAWTAVDDAEDHITDALRVNYEGPKNLATAALNSQTRLIHISTDYVFSGDATEPYEVDTPTNPLNAYGRTKQMGDSAVLTIGSGQFPIVRTAWLYSRYGQNFAKTMAKRAVQNQPVNVVCDQIGQPTSATDLANLIMRVGSHPNPPSIIHGTNAGQASWFDFATAIYSALNSRVELVTPVTSDKFPTKALRPKYSVLSHDSFRKSELIGMREWRSALSDVIEEIRDAVEEEIQ
jgi:dTDP-4-dehydrorhamnose reductase